MSPIARTLRYLREQGYRAEVVEKTIPRTFIKKDLWGADILAIKGGSPLLAIQCTSGGNVPVRVQKLKANGHDEVWKSVGATIEVWGWAKRGPRGERKVWTLRREAM